MANHFTPRGGAPSRDAGMFGTVVLVAFIAGVAFFAGAAASILIFAGCQH